MHPLSHNFESSVQWIILQSVNKVFWCLSWIIFIGRTFFMADNSSTLAMCWHLLLSLVTNSSNSINKRSFLPLHVLHFLQCVVLTEHSLRSVSLRLISTDSYAVCTHLQHFIFKSPYLFLSHARRHTTKPCWTLPILQDGYKKQFVKLTRTYCCMPCVVRSLSSVSREEKRK